MKIEKDDDKYDKFQEHILENIVREIKDTLEEKGVDEDLIYDITGDLAFSICAIVDSSRVMEVEGEPVLPFLTFAKSDKKEELIAMDGGSYMHEMAFGFTDEVFDEEE